MVGYFWEYWDQFVEESSVFVSRLLKSRQITSKVLGSLTLFCLLTSFYFKYILLIMLVQLSHFFPFIPLCHAPPIPPALPHLSSCPWVVHISSLTSPFPILFLTSPCLFCTYQLCFLFLVPFLPFSSLTLPADNLLCDLYFCESVPLSLIGWICFCFCFVFVFLALVVDSCEFVAFYLSYFWSSFS